MTDDRLYDLLPAVHRRLDADEGAPLRALLQVIGEQADVLESDIAQMYENWFVETAEDWIVPYLGDLVGYRPVHAVDESSGPATQQGTALNRILAPRRDVANTIRNRRRKGTLALLEDLTFDVATWPARAVEYYRLLVESVSPDFPHLDRGRTVDVRDVDALELLDSPFDRLAHVVDVRSPNGPAPRGRHNLPNVGVFAWRLRPYTVTDTSAYCLEEVGPHNFAFSILGNDAPLFARPLPEPDGHIADEVNLPVPIRRRALERGLADGARMVDGPDASFVITLGEERVPIPGDRLVAADLSDWSYVARRGTVAVDPEFGRVSFPPSEAPDQGVWVTYRYGFPTGLGGGEYERSVSQPVGARVYTIDDRSDPGSDGDDGGDDVPVASLADALARWREEQPLHAVIEFRRSGYHVDAVDVDLAAGQTLQIRAAVGVRPVIRLLDRQPGRADSMRIRGRSGSHFTLDGLIVTGRAIRVEGDVASVRIRHTTLVPGWDLQPNCDPRRPTEPSIELIETGACLSVDHSIIGSIQVSGDEVTIDPSRIEIADSMVDATSERLEAIGGVGWPIAHVTLRVARTTIVGTVQVHALELAENTIFLGDVCVARSQIGCVRFSYVPDGSRTPRRHRCQPDLVVATIRGDRPEDDYRRERACRRVRPRFDSLSYGTSDYARLALGCADEIRRGADDRSEMGVYHDLFEPQRLANLTARLDEHVPASVDVGIYFAT